MTDQTEAEREVARLRSVLHQAYGHLDCLLLYATAHPADSHVIQARKFMANVRGGFGNRWCPSHRIGFPAAERYLLLAAISETFVMADFTRPPIARQHCRHYGYTPGLKGGPTCAVGIDNSSGPVTKCMPDPKAPCPSRQEWSDEERATWEAWSEAARLRLGAAVQALPKAIPLRSGGTIDCPNCDGKLRYDRWHRGAEIHCSTPMCCAAHFSIAPAADWPASA